MKINLGPKVRITDPGYEDETTWRAGTLENVLPGVYDCKIDIVDEGSWGDRVASITVTHEEGYTYFADEEAPFEVGVDSGQACICDYDYWLAHHTEQAFDDPDGFYGKCCELTLSSEQGGIVDDACLVSCSGYGDGRYTCSVGRDSNGYIVCIKIVFFNDEDEEEYDEDEEDEEDFE